MPRDARKYLFDIGEASDLISQIVAGKTLDDYLKSALLQSGVERQFEIIGEALGQLAKVDQQLLNTRLEASSSGLNPLWTGCFSKTDSSGPLVGHSDLGEATTHQPL